MVNKNETGKNENPENHGNKEKYDLLDVYFFKDLVKNRFFKPVSQLFPIYFSSHYNLFWSFK